MLYLVFAILSSASISVLMRFGNSHIRNNMVMFFMNYAACGVLSFLFMTKAYGNPAGFLLQSTEGLEFTIFLGLLSGLMYLVSFVLLQFNIRNNGLTMSSISLGLS